MIKRLVRHLKAQYYLFLRKFCEPVVTDEFGIKIRLRKYDTTPIKKILTRENYKPEFRVYDQYAKSGVIIDAGANIGVHSVYFSRIADMVYAFEPVPRNFEQLEENIRLNKRKNIIPVPTALGNTEGEIEMNIFPPERSLWDSIHIPDIPEEVSGNSPVSKQNVAITTLDEFTKEHNISKVRFLKLDVEGHELAVLQGSRRLLAEHRIDTIQFEVAEWLTKDAMPIFDLLQSYGYRTNDPYIPSSLDKNYLAFSIT